MELRYIMETVKGIQEISAESRLFTDRRIFITEEINTETANDFIKKMIILSAEDKPIDIYISSPGGEITAGLAMYDMIQSCPCTVNTYCIGQASSMAAVLLASGRKGRRFILPHSKVMIHEALLRGGIGGSATSIAILSEAILETRDLVNGILAKHTGKSLAEVNEATAFDNLMNADGAVAFGICDKVIDSIYERRN